jgi:hemolysin D
MKHVLLGVKDFLVRYAAVFRSAWAVRQQLEPVQRSDDERAFLPAHLELTEAPTSPAARWFMRLIIAFFCVALLWACIGKLDIVAVAPGKIVVGSRTKILQTAETAVVKRILVRDGQRVKRGQLLIELDATATAADFSQADDALITAKLTELRQSALKDALAHGRPPRLQSAGGIPQARIAAEQALATSTFSAFNAKRQNLEATIAQRRAELQTLQSMIGPLEDTARIAKSRADDYARLVEGKYVGRHEYLLREQERIAAERDLTAQRGRLSEARSAVQGAEEQLHVLVADMRQQTLESLRQASEQVAQLTPQVAKTQQRNTLMQLRAPVDGSVQQLAVHTVGGVVTPAQPLLAVVPSEESMEVEATVLNKDIGFVHARQPVTVKVESFPYTRYGYLEGSVESISHDAAQNEKMGLIFPARIRLKHTHLNIDGVRVAMTPGMSLSVEIKTGKRRVIDYLISPLRTNVGEAFREK